MQNFTPTTATNYVHNSAILSMFPPCNFMENIALFLNQVRAWFLEIAFVQEVSMRVCVDVCVSAPEAINN